MRQWSPVLKKNLQTRPDACCWLLNELARSHSTTENSLKELLLSPDDIVRHSTMTVCCSALRGAAFAAGGGGSNDGCGRENGDAMSEYDVYRRAYTAEMEEEEGFAEKEEWRADDVGLAEQGFCPADGQEQSSAAPPEVKAGGKREERRTVRFL